MKVQVRPAEHGLSGRFRLPGDKSISHRAALFGGLATGETLIEGFLPGEDCLTTLRVLRQLGVTIHRGKDNRVRVIGRGGSLLEPTAVLDAANSGTTARLLLGILAGQPFSAVLTGDRSLRNRPMRRVVDPLTRMGAAFVGRAGEDRLPLAVRGRRPLLAGDFTLPVASAQLKSALLLAGLAADGETRVTEPLASRDHTERLLPSFGQAVRRNGNAISIVGGGRLEGCRVAVPGDPSSAIFPLVAATIVPGSRVELLEVGLNPLRTGALTVLRRMGARVVVEDMVEQNGEPRGTLRVESAALTATAVEAWEVPSLIDEVPVLAVAACFAKGTTVFRGVGELRAKETDRLAVLQAELGALGAAVAVRGDDLEVTGGPLRGGLGSSHGDHRIAMALSVAGLASNEGVKVDGAEAVDVSFPGYFALLDKLAPGTI